MALETGDFVKIDYTGKIKDTEAVFDTTMVDIAKETNLYSDKMKYGPIVICIGENHVLPGLDTHMVGKEEKTEFELTLTPDMAFGNRNPKLVQLIAMSKFKKNKINPFPGLQVDVDGQNGIVKSVSGGRIIVDFNHPLAGKTLIYNVKIYDKIIDEKEKIDGFLSLITNQDLNYTYDNGVLTIRVEIDKEMLGFLEKQLSKMLKKKIKVKLAKD